jgi:hypothetical protein
VNTDVLVIGGGNAALVSALTAADGGARVLLLERAPAHFRGGNSRHTRNIRCAHNTGDGFTTGPYPYAELWRDLCTVGDGPSDERLAEMTVRQSTYAPDWMAAHGAHWQPALSGTLNLARTNRFFLGGGKAPAACSSAGRRLGTGLAFAAVCVVLALLSYLFTGRSFVVADTPGDPYEILPHVPLLIAVGAPSLWAAGMFGWAALRYWRDIHGRPADLFRPCVWLTTFTQAVQLRHMTGADAGCERPGRRGFHLVLLYGFGLCVLSTAAAAFAQNVVGAHPPYPWLSVPVASGSVGGVAMLVGGTGLWVRSGGSGFLWALLVLAATGMLTLLLRETVAFGPLFLLHVAAVVVAFGTAPYSKFVHGIFRMLSIHHDNLER